MFFLISFASVSSVVCTLETIRDLHSNTLHSSSSAAFNLNLNHIVSTQREEIISSIYAFPYANYPIFLVQSHGYFYLDPINDLIKNHLRRGGTWEPFIRTIIQKHARPGSIALDIGAHIGLHTIIMSRSVGVDGEVLAFEPQPKIFRELFMNMSLNNVSNVRFFWAGVGSTIGQVELTLLMSNGPIEMNEAGTPLNGGSGKFVDLLSIDTLNLKNVSLIKIDVEGQENAVLDGAKETILNNRPIIVIEIMGGHNIDTAPPHIREQILYTINKIGLFGYKVQRLRGHDYIAFPPEALETVSSSIRESHLQPNW